MRFFLIVALMTVPLLVNAEPAEISSCCGGGVTGGYGCDIIENDGTIISRGKSAFSEPEETTLKIVDKKLADYLFGKIVKINFQHINYSGSHGNYNCSLSLKTNKEDHSINWSDDEAPKVVVDFQQEITSLILAKKQQLVKQPTR